MISFFPTSFSVSVVVVVVAVVSPDPRFSTVRSPSLHFCHSQHV